MDALSKHFKRVYPDPENPLYFWGERDVFLGGRMFTVRATIYAVFLEPHGFLPRDVHAHALFNYAHRACNLISAQAKLQYEHEESRPEPAFRRLLENITYRYGVDADACCRFWKEVDLQFEACALPKIPPGEKYRFDTPMIVRAH